MRTLLALLGLTRPEIRGEVEALRDTNRFLSDSIAKAWAQAGRYAWENDRLRQRVEELERERAMRASTFDSVIQSPRASRWWR